MTLIIGETGRSGGNRARGQPGARGAPASVMQWSCRWAKDGPGPVTPGCEGEPDLSLALNPEDARLVAEGKLTPSVAFMQGRLKTSGDNVLLLEALAWSATPSFAATIAQWRGASNSAAHQVSSGSAAAQ